MMQEFIELFKSHYFTIIYLVALLLAIRFYKKYFDTALKYFPIIIAYTFFNELLGYYIRYNEGFAFFSKYTSANDLIYNIYTVVFFGYFYHVYWKLIQLDKQKKIVAGLSVIAVIGLLINGFFLNPLTTNLFYATCLCSWILVIIIGMYFKSRKNDWLWASERFNLMFWVSSGLAVFHFFLPILFLIGFLKHSAWIEYDLRTVVRILIVIMYASFCLGFVISRRRAFR
ncbi:hypothetical protein FGF1_30320 [Flavobacteriaceae bacterium GF1]